jgi:FMN reductase
MSTFVALVGNPRPASRTAQLAGVLLDALTARLGGGEPRLLDLAQLLDQHGSLFGTDAAPRWAEPLAVVRSSRLLVVATPTYKASYTGLLKAFADHVPAGDWSGVVAVPVLTVGSPGHALAADVHLRPLLLELGAVTPTASLLAVGPELDDPRAVVDRWLERAAPVLESLLSVPARLA